MAEVVNMPRLSDTMEEGIIAKWHKKVGDTVNEGDLLAEIETDKATMDFEAFQEGILLHIGVEEGVAVPVDSMLAILGEEGENIEELISGEIKGREEITVKETTSSEKDEEHSSPPNDEESREIKASQNKSRINASPLAKKLAEEENIDLYRVKGSGESGRIIKRDIDNFKEEMLTSVAQAPIEVKYEEHNISQMRKTIAKRLSESKFSAPHFYLTLDINMGKAIELRKAINETGEQKISYNDIIIKAVAVTLKKHPQVNSSWLGDKIRINHVINIGVAVAVDEGVLVPVICNADQKSLSMINAEVKDYVEKARNKSLQLLDCEGSTFTISNLGMFGIEEFTAIINPPDSCIMAVGAIKQVPVVKNGKIVPGNVMRVSLSCDHRVVDGATGSAFLQTFKSMIENPINMLI